MTALARLYAAAQQAALTVAVWAAVVVLGIALLIAGTWYLITDTEFRRGEDDMDGETDE